MKRSTVHDVAEQAGVSLATVDRVLNHRPGVSQATTLRVRATIERIGFRRDHYAASLATSRRHRFAFVLPKLDGNTFVCTLRETLAAQAETLAARRIQLAVHDYIPFDGHALAAVLHALARQDGSAPRTDGIAVMAVDAAPVRSAIEALHEAGMPVITLISDVTPSPRLHCVGIDDVAAGRVAASLIGRFNAGRSGTVAMIAGSMAMRDHSERALGFTQVMQQDHARLRVLRAAEGLDDGAITTVLTQDLLDRHDDLIGLYSIGGGNRGIAATLEASRRQLGIVVVAHEVTPYTRRALLAGTFDALLHQPMLDEIMQAVETLRTAADGEAQSAPAPIRLEIVLRDNLS